MIGRYFLQEYETTGGQRRGPIYEWTCGGRRKPASARGRTLLIGTFPGAGYYLHHSPESKAFFVGLLKLANVKPQLRSDNGSFRHDCIAAPGGNYLSR